MRGGLADLPGNWSRNAGFLKVVLRHNKIRLRLKDCRLCAVRRRFGIVALKLRDAASIGLQHTVVVAVGATLLCLRGRKVCLALIHNGLIALTVEDIENSPLLDDIAFLELYLFNVSIHLG